MKKKRDGGQWRIKQVRKIARSHRNSANEKCLWVKENRKMRGEEKGG